MTRRERRPPPRNIKNGCTIESILSRDEDDEETTTTAFNHPRRRRRRDLMMLTSSVFVFPTNAFNAWAAALDDDETKHQKLITNQVFFEFAIDGTKIGRVVVGVYGNESITARRFLALSKGIQGLSYRRKPIIGIEENEDETVETPLWITSSAIAKFEAPGTGEAINTVPGGLTNEELLMDLGKIKHDRANLVSVQVRDDPRMPKPEPKSKLVSNRGKFERVYEPLPPEPNGTSFSITYAPSEDLDVTNAVSYTHLRAHET